MKFQKSNYTCGPASIVNALRCLGVYVTEDQVLKHSNTTKTDGTDEPDMVRAIKKLGFDCGRHEQGKWSVAWRWLQNNIKDGTPMIAVVDEWDHYVTVIGMIGKKVVVFDPGKWGEAKKENGVFVFSKQEWKEKWLNHEENLFCGISIKQK